MTAFLRKNLTRLILCPNSNNVCESPLYLSLYLNNFCTSSESGLDINHNLSHILVHKHNFNPEFVARVASKLIHVKKAENAGLVLSFLRESGFPDYRLERIVKDRPRLLSASLENIIKPKINFFQEMGISSDRISKMISRHPGLLVMSLKGNIIPSVALLKRLLGSNDAVARVIQLAPRILASNFENAVLPKVDFFKSFGVPLERIRTVLISNPSNFLLKLEVLKKSAEIAKEMGVTASSDTFIYAVTAIAATRWTLKLQAVRSLGFSDSDIVIMCRKVPQVFNVSIGKMKKIIELLLGTNKYTMSSIVDCPKSLQYSIEKRYMPRLQILRNLESRGLIKEWPSLSKVAAVSDDKFFKEFVIPYSDKVSHVCSIDNPAKGERKREATVVCGAIGCQKDDDLVV